jgi:hypothetical protein
MSEKKTLRTIIIENWEKISKTLDLSMENKPENSLLILNHLRPFLDSAAIVFPRPSAAIYVSVEEAYRKNISLLEKMGFVKDGGYSNSYGLTIEGVDLMNCYNKQINSKFLTDEELLVKFYKLSDHLD